MSGVRVCCVIRERVVVPGHKSEAVLDVAACVVIRKCVVVCKKTHLKTLIVVVKSVVAKGIVAAAIDANSIIIVIQNIIGDIAVRHASTKIYPR
jgi:hypothetical protein